jgi:exopolysaccharide biosynthesis polyprenyl glycosylphosphotransferase
VTTADERLTSEYEFDLALDLEATRAVTPLGRTSAPRPRWERRYAFWLPFGDALALLLAVSVAQLLRSLAPGPVLPSTSPTLLVIGVSLGWVAVLALCGAYESRTLGQGPEEYKRVISATWHIAGVLAIGSYAVQATLARGFLLLAIPLGGVTLLASRHAVRRFVWSCRAKGQALHRLLVVGPMHPAAEVIREINSDQTGFTVVGVCTGGLLGDGGQHALPTVGDFNDILGAVERTKADTVAVVGALDMPHGFLRDLAWQLEGTGVDLIISPATADIAGPRIRMRPVARLSMLYVEEPQLRGAARLMKATFDKLVAGFLLLVISPLLIAVAIGIKATSRGPVMFRQRRAGLNGEYFRIWKFRTMHDGADKLGGYDLAAELNGGRGKAPNDPRVTRFGKLLRQTSLDELPQLINVLCGQMSLVGPRPVPAEVESFADHELRRLLVKPGMTGLWQVSGRSDLAWQERVRLDLYYVENWSPVLDIVIMFRTISVVLRGQGAY